MGVMQADSDYGEVILVENNALGQWGIFYGEKGIYFEHDSDARLCKSYGKCVHNCYDYTLFRPTLLTVRHSSQKSFAHGFFHSNFASKLQLFQIANIGIHEFHSSGLLGADALKSLNLSHNALTEMPSKAFTNAKNLIEIDLSYNYIAKMPSDVFMVESENSEVTAEMQHDMTSNGSNDSSLRFVKVIRLERNNLTFIHSDWFSELVNLTTLTLNDNLLAEFNICTFSKNYALRVLHLQNNDCHKYFTDFCYGRYDTFDISNNPRNGSGRPIRVDAKEINISNTHSHNCFIPQVAKIFRASHNRIYSVIYAEPVSLTELYLNHNKIDSANFLRAMDRLEKLDLSNNRLYHMGLTVFEEMVNLTMLNISHNFMTTIDFTFLASANKLNYLDISYNRFDGRFHLNVKSNSLSQLNIAGNFYTSFEDDLRKQAPNLTAIDFNDNDLYCEELTSILLLMHFHLIRPVLRVDNENNVKDIKCHRRPS